jgi:hypothetical protein
MQRLRCARRSSRGEAAEKSRPTHRGREPWRAESPGELRAVHGPKPPAQWWRTLAWSKPLKAAGLRVLFRAHAVCAYFNVGTDGAGGEGCVLRRVVGDDRLRSACFGRVRNRVCWQRTTGGDEAPGTAYGCARGTKLWRAQPHERIRHETRPAGAWRMKASRGRENLRTQAGRVR